MLFCLDGQFDCGPGSDSGSEAGGEDEEDCEITEEVIKKMKNECEGNSVSRHVMCPNTYICIKEDWLCGKQRLKSLVT